MNEKDQALVSKEKRKKYLKDLFFFFFFLGAVGFYITENITFNLGPVPDMPFFIRFLSLCFFVDITCLSMAGLLAGISWIISNVFKKDLSNDSTISQLIHGLIIIICLVLSFFIFYALCYAYYNDGPNANAFVAFSTAAAIFDLIIRCILILKHHLDYKKAIKTILEEK